MGDFLTSATGTKNAIAVTRENAYDKLNPSLQQQNQLIGTLQTEAAGGGPNPAQMQYLQNSQQITQQQANAYAQNRALNPGLAARLAGQQAASTAQRAAGTAGIQQAQQQLASQGLLGNTLAQQQGALNNAGAINAGVAGANQQAAQGIVGGIFQGAGMAAGLAHGGMVSHYDAGGEIFNPMTSAIAAPVSVAPIAMPAPVKSGFDMYSPKKGGGSKAAPASSADKVPPEAIEAAALAQGGPVEMPEHLHHVASIYHPHMVNVSQPGAPIPKPHAEPKINQVPEKDRFYAQGGKVPAMVSPGEEYIPPKNVGKVASGEMSPSKAGEKIPGKAKVKGDSQANDTVPKKLDEGGVVIPRSVFEADDPEKEAKKFVAQAIAKHKKSPEGEFKEALKRAVAGRKNK